MLTRIARMRKFSQPVARSGHIQASTIGKPVRLSNHA